MRVNKFVAQATGLSRRTADRLIQEGRVQINRRQAGLGDQVAVSNDVTLDGQSLNISESLTVMLNKPVGYVCSRNGQGSRTIYELLPPEYQELKPVGRLDKDSSGLLLVTNDGDLADQLMHPRHAKSKTYEVVLDQPLTPAHRQLISGQGVQLDDGLSRFAVEPLRAKATDWQITMQEGRNRQIRRTFAVLGYQVTALHRTQFGDYRLASLPSGQHQVVRPKPLGTPAETNQ